MSGSLSLLHRPLRSLFMGVMLYTTLPAMVAMAQRTTIPNACTSLSPGGSNVRMTASGRTATCTSTGRQLPRPGGDPFVFCTEGVPTDCWVAVSPVSGAWQSICLEYVNPRWIPTYEYACPLGRPRDGTGYNWQGRGIPSQRPSYH